MKKCDLYPKIKEVGKWLQGDGVAGDQCNYMHV